MRLNEVRCIVQDKDGTDKYYPKILSARTTETFPWSCPIANIEINSNAVSGSSGYMSPIRNDDIIRLQVNTRNKEAEKSIWQDIFEGRIMDMSSDYGYTLPSMTTLLCRGHGEELLYRPAITDYSVASARTGAILAALVSNYLDRLTDDSLIDTTASTVIPDFNIKQDTKFIGDAVKELEALEAYGYILNIITNYDSAGDLDTNLVSWQPVPDESITVKIIQGTPRLIGARFSKSIENVVEDVTIYGASGTPQKVGISQDGTPEYGTRFHIGVDTSIASNNLCTSLAVATRSRFGAGITVGAVRILGDANISVGDLLRVKIPHLILDGSAIDGTYRVKRMSHAITVDGWYTDLDLGDLIESPADILVGQHTKNRLTAANFIE